MIDMTNSTAEDQLIVGESQTMRNRIRQRLSRAALDVQQAQPVEGEDQQLAARRRELARRILQNVSTHADTMTPAIVAELQNTSDEAITDAIGQVWDSYLGAV